MPAVLILLSSAGTAASSSRTMRRANALVTVVA
jgi:hypothetical protein